MKTGLFAIFIEAFIQRTIAVVAGKGKIIIVGIRIKSPSCHHYFPIRLNSQGKSACIETEVGGWFSIAIEAVIQRTIAVVAGKGKIVITRVVIKSLSGHHYFTILLNSQGISNIITAVEVGG